MPITIRPACPDDWTTIVDYNCRLAEETEGTSLRRELIEPGVKSLLGDASRGRYFVACDAETIVGQLMHTHEWSDWRNGDIWWLQSVYVHPDYRRQGVFRLMYEHLAAEAKSREDVAGLRLYVEVENERARATYSEMGLDTSRYVMMERMFV